MASSPIVETTEDRLRRDVAALCVTPRHRDLPGSLDAARGYCRGQLEQSGWSVDERPFRPRPAWCCGRSARSRST